jgi:hypothetical protein
MIGLFSFSKYYRVNALGVCGGKKALLEVRRALGTQDIVFALYAEGYIAGEHG